jgi:hypothetical protein
VRISIVFLAFERGAVDVLADGAFDNLTRGRMKSRFLLERFGMTTIVPR